MILEIKSYAKINLWLSLLGKRPDGFHEIRTLLQTIDLHDDLSASPAEGSIVCECSHPDVPSGDGNLVVRAARALQSLSGTTKGAKFSLVKRIPIGGGLGGGSSNAAMALILLNRLWDLDLDAGELAETAAQLGSDVPFFLTGGLCLGIGRGEEVYSLEQGDTFWVVVATSGMKISTREVYEKAGKLLTSTGAGAKITRLNNLLSGGRLGEPPRLENDLEEFAADIDPGIPNLKAELIGQGARCAMLSGSGSAVFGLFEDQRSALQALGSLRDKGVSFFLCSSLHRIEYRKGFHRIDMKD